MQLTLVILATVVLVAMTPARAQRLGADYYFDRSDSVLLQQLSNVDRFHLAQCADSARTRQYMSSLADCEFILRYFPNHPKALLALADICFVWKNPRCNPDPFFALAIAVNPNASATYSTQGIYLLRAGRVDNAIASLKQAAALDPNSVNAHYNLGLAYFEAKQYDLANASAQRAYLLGAPVPGLRDKLRKAGYWKPDAASSSEPAQPAPKGQTADAPKQ